MSVVKIGPLDMMWANSRIISAVGPVDVGRTEQIAATVRELAVRGGPGTRFGLLPTTESKFWQYAPETFLGDVTALPDCSAEDLPALLTQRARTGSSLNAIDIAVAGEYLIVDMCHGLGDAHLVNMLNYVLGQRSAGGNLPEWSCGAPAINPLGQAIARFYSSRPCRVGSILRNRHRHVAEPASEPDLVPWQRAPIMLASRSQDGAIGRLRRSRDRTSPDLSIASMVFAALVSAVRSRGVGLHDSVNVVVDCRRYLPKNSRVFGNFVSGVDIAVPDPGDPRQLHRGIAEATSCGRPLAALLLNAQKFHSRYRRGQAFSAATCTALTPRAKLVFSHVGDVFAGAGGDTTRRFGNCINEPKDPEAIVFTITRRASEFDLSASFHSNVYSPELIQSVLDDVAHEPERALTQRMKD